MCMTKHGREPGRLPVAAMIVEDGGTLDAAAGCGSPLICWQRTGLARPVQHIRPIAQQTNTISAITQLNDRRNRTGNVVACLNAAEPKHCDPRSGVRDDFDHH